MSWATLCERLRMLFSVGLSADVTADSLFLYLMQLFFSLLFHRDKWESMLKIVRCEIISMTRNDTIDAYVLRFVTFFLVE